MLPEALIRIYSRVNDITYSLAEKELRFGAYYDDEPEAGGNEEENGSNDMAQR